MPATKPKRTPVSSPRGKSLVGRARVSKRAAKRSPFDTLQHSVAGKDSYAQVLRFSDDDVLGHVRKLVSTRSIAIDAATNVGGFPFGRVVEVYGGETVGKTTLTDHVMAEVQAIGGVCAVYDSEHKKDRNYSQALGVNIRELGALEPLEEYEEEVEHKGGKVKKQKGHRVGNKTVEAAIEVTRRALEGWITDGHANVVPLCIVWDTVAGMPTLDEILNPTSERPGVAAKQLRRAMRQLIGLNSRAGALLCIVNQQYEKIGGGIGFGGVKRSTYGGGGIRYHSTMRLEMIRTGSLKGPGGVVMGLEGLVRIYKNGMAAPRDEEYAIQWGLGVNNAWSIVEKLTAAKYIVQPKGSSWQTFQVQGGEPVTWQGGWYGLSQLFVQHPTLYAQMAVIYQGLPAGPTGDRK